MKLKTLVKYKVNGKNKKKKKTIMDRIFEEKITDRFLRLSGMTKKSLVY